MVVILAIALGLSVLTFTVAASIALISDKVTLSEAQTALLSTVLGGLLGAVATYVGVNLTNGRKE